MDGATARDLKRTKLRLFMQTLIALASAFGLTATEEITS
jgi:hypothetical protein